MISKLTLYIDPVHDKKINWSNKNASRSCIDLFILVLFLAPNILNAQSQDCLNAIPVCTNGYHQAASSTGFGTTQEILPGSSCLGNGETNSTWYAFKIQTPGTLLFQINPINAQDDYDYILYDITNNSCTDILSGAIQPVRCNYSSAAGATGLVHGAVNVSSNASGSNQCAELVVALNETYALMVNNFTATNSGYDLNFSGSAIIYDTQPPALSSAHASECSPGKVALVFSESILCSSIASDGSDFYITGPSAVSISSASGTGCNGSLLGTSIKINFANPVLTSGTYQVHIRPGADGNTVGDFCGNMINNGAVISFDVLYNAPAASIASVTNETCTTQGSATGSVTGGTPPYIYSWDCNPPQTSLIASNLSAGVYTFNVTDAHGCMAHSTAHIYQTGIPQLSFAITDVRCDSLTSGEATVTVTGGTPPYQYFWHTNPVQTSATATGLTSGNYIVTVTTADGCIVEDTISIPLIGVPQIAITHSNVSCNGLSLGSAEANVTGNGPFTYEWNTNPPAYTSQVSNLLEGSYSVNVIDALGCESNASAIIGKGGMLLSTLQVDLTCASEHAGVATVNATNGTPPYTYEWNTTPVQNTPSAINLDKGVYAVTVHDAGGCEENDSVSILSPPPIAINISTSNSACGNNSGTATANIAGGFAPYLFSWNTVPVQNDSLAINLAAGIYSLTITDSAGCVATQNAYVANSNGPQGFITDVIDATCDFPNGGAMVTGVTGNAPFNYMWDTHPPQFTAQSTHLAGNDTYYVGITDVAGCVSFLHVKINGNEKAALSLLSLDSASCNGNDGSATVMASGGATPYQFLWSTMPMQQSQTAAHIAAGNYLATITDGNGCIDSLQVVLPERKAVTSFSFSPACLNEPVYFTAATNDSDAASYQWNFGDGYISTCYEPFTSHVFSDSLSHLVTLYIVGGCASDTLLKSVKGAYIPHASFAIENENSYASAPVQFHYTGSTVENYAWNFGDGESATEAAPSHVYESPMDSAIITLIVTDQNGCLDTTSEKLYVDVPPAVYFPNCFTPNNDGLNDTFKVPSTGLSSCSVKIFNRWGELIFSSDNLSFLKNTGWDGTVKGKPVPEDSYVFVMQAISADGKALTKQGNILLFR